MTKRVLRRKEVEQQTGLSRSTIYARMEQGTFPKSIPLGGRLVGWLESDVNDWIEQQISCSQRAA
ncbi:MAG: hypothetical protein CMI12_01625 [Oceanospirillum sp.]|nr:hypothetical protein [Oceanospirillum sp.]